ncbi:Glutathione peroxidase family protein [Rhodopirellula islandica]|uniref:Glutathione peroxidase n=1 Tax=Rhodopirellula islandica TaxID=595434 RepID=A0A0J1BIK0_RHOIS|nr:glutathione peroxidase [Rhodopirellula islandica]KLU06375.1 Glutathione peroxidase family protein [Rhodopirellula islandica]
MSRFLLLSLALGCLMNTSQPVSAADSTADHECVLAHEAQTIEGKEVDLHDFEGKVVLIVNVASKCGYTKQYAGLQSLYEAHKEDGLVILGFPCNQFGSQEPGTNADILEFCSARYNVTFPMMGKVDVNGDEASPLYKQLTSVEAKPAGKGPISWNFEKFLIGRDGQVIGRYKSKVAPSDDELVSAIKAALKG